MQTIKDIYTKYKVPPNLQQHMLRVTGIAKIISDNWTGEQLDTNTLLLSCLTHDMGNLLKFDLINKVNFLGEETINLDYWKTVKAEMIEKYGADEHAATAAICRELGLNKKSLWIVENWGFSNFEKVLTSNNWEYKIGVYSDHRISPLGVVSLKERFAEQKKRYEQQEHKSVDLNAHLSNKSEILISCAFEVEKVLQKNTLINLNTVSDLDIETNFADFLKYKI